MSNNASFLPEDYLAQKAERRTNIISLVLFGVVMFAVFLAFMVTNQHVVHRQGPSRRRINARYQQAAEEIRRASKSSRRSGEGDDAQGRTRRRARRARAAIDPARRDHQPNAADRAEPASSFELTSEQSEAPSRVRRARRKSKKTGASRPVEGQVEARQDQGTGEPDGPPKRRSRRSTTWTSRSSASRRRISRSRCSSPSSMPSAR